MAPTLDELSRLLPDRSINLTAAAEDRDDAIRQAGAFLVQAGAVEPEYVEQMLEREHVVSTFVGDGIAMPHGTLTAKSDVLNEGLSVLVLDRTRRLGRAARHAGHWDRSTWPTLHHATEPARDSASG